MTRKRDSTSLNPVSSEWGPNHDVAVVLAAAFGHSKENVRSALRARLNVWVRRRQPVHGVRSIRQAILRESGTALEPFRLSDEQLALAMLAVRAAFSEAADWPFIRIVSEETIGVDGGLVLSRSLASHYCERFAFAAAKRHSSTDKNTPYIAPAELLTRRKSPGRLSAQSIEAWMSITHTGFIIRITFGGPNRICWTGNGELSGSSKRLQQWGIWAKVDRDAVLVGSTNTDAFLKLSAHLMDRPVLRLQVAYCEALFLQLRMPENERTRIPALLLGDDPLAECCSLGLEFDFPLTVGDRLAIAQEFQPPSQWITSDFLEAWSETV